MYIVLSVLGLTVIAFGFAFAAERQNKFAAIGEIARKRHIIEAQREQLESIKEMLRNARSQEDEARAEAAADGLLAQLKPEYRERAETEKRFNALEGAMADVKSLLREMADELKNNRTQNNA